MTTRLKPDKRYDEIIYAALKLARYTHYVHLSAKRIAHRAGCSDSLVVHYLGPLLTMRAIVLSEAIRRGDRTVITQGMTHNAITPKGYLCPTFKILIKEFRRGQKITI